MRFIDRDLQLLTIYFYSPVKFVPCFNLNQRVELWTVNPVRAGTRLCFMLF